MYRFFVLSLFFLIAARADDGGPCPMFFLMHTLDEYTAMCNAPNTTVVYADDGQMFVRPPAPPVSRYVLLRENVDEIAARVRHGPCVQYVAVVSDDFARNEADVVEWIVYTCALYGKAYHDCHLPNDFQRHYKSRVLLPREDKVVVVDEDKVRVTARTPVRECMSVFTKEPCRKLPECFWFNAVYGCREKSFCGFHTRDRCVSRHMYCVWRGGRCVSKHKP
jgi:hypothetical protein